MAVPKLTYIVPVYNTGHYVLRCLQSIVGQGIPSDDYEIIVVDDGSTDQSCEIVEPFAAEHPQVRLLTQPNSGVSVARNLAIDNARGQFIQFVDSDDYLSDNMIAPLLQRAIDQNLDLLVFNYETVDGDTDNITAHDRNDNYPTSTVATGHEYLQEHAMTPYIWRFLIRREFLNQGGWRFNPSLIVCEDGAMIAQFLLRAQRVAHDEAAPYRYVRRADSAMHNQDVDHLRKRVFSQVDSAALIDQAVKQYEEQSGMTAPASVLGLRNVYLYFSMTKALMCGFVGDVIQRIKDAGLYPFPCVGPEANYYGTKWKIIHRLMMSPRLWTMLSKFYRMIK